MPAVYLGLGSNIEPQKHLRFGLFELERRFGRLTKSSVYRSKSYGFDGEDFLNMVVSLDTRLSPIELHGQIGEIQEAAGRDRTARGYSPRTLDIDILLYDDLVVDDPPIRLPRPDVLRFSFVLGPLAEIAPELVHPETGQSFEAHWRKFDVERHPISRVSVIL
ncbi:MAG: 2-amino-4-hydroxy-6-hydroxymethyldihydropteridine diphosphokinase [Woeseiaceae bacterium]